MALSLEPSPPVGSGGGPIPPTIGGSWIIALRIRAAVVRTIVVAPRLAKIPDVECQQPSSMFRLEMWFMKSIRYVRVSLSPTSRLCPRMQAHQPTHDACTHARMHACTHARMHATQQPRTYRIAKSRSGRNASLGGAERQHTGAVARAAHAKGW